MSRSIYLTTGRVAVKTLFVIPSTSFYRGSTVSRSVF